jgi:hypothetical protein
LILDLADLSFADAEGIALLRSLRRDNVNLLNSSPYLALQVGDRKGEEFSAAT